MNKHPKKDEMIEAIRDLLKDGHEKKDIKEIIQEELKKEPNPPTFQTIYDWIKEVEEKIQEDGWISEHERARKDKLETAQGILDDLRVAYALENDPKEKRKIGQAILNHPFMKKLH